MIWMLDVHDKIKIVIWDLDDTLWNGTLAENDDVVPYGHAVDLISELDSRGIVSVVCSKNDRAAALAKLEELGLKDAFVDFAISFASKGPVIRRLLSELNLRAVNALFVDDNPTNLREAVFFNHGLNVASADCISALADNEYLAGSPDPEHGRHAQYVQLARKRDARMAYEDDDAFLRDLDIKVRFIKAGESNIDRIHELSERTNQLNFTKDRADRDSLLRLSRDVTVDMKCIRVMDKFGDDGIVGFYAMRDHKLIHFVFSCRILGMRVEQWLWEYLGYPDLRVNGEVAVELRKDTSPIDFVTVDTSEDEAGCDSVTSVDTYVSDDDMLRILGIGACDLFYPIAGAAMHGSRLRYECNVFNGVERGVNTGTEYLRSCFDMTDEQKAYCVSRFKNYTGPLAFQTQLVSDKFDYVILSFHDDIVYKTFWSKTDQGLRVIRTDEPTSGVTSVIERLSDGRVGRLSEGAAAEYMGRWFFPGERISHDRFLDNLRYLMDRCDPCTRFVLIGAPDIGFYWDKRPVDDVIFSQARMINSSISDFVSMFPDRCAMVDLTKIVTSKADVGNYVFHFGAKTSHAVMMAVLQAMASIRIAGRKSLLSGLPVGERRVVLAGSGLEARKAYWNLKILNEDPGGFFYDSNIGERMEDGMVCRSMSELSGLAEKFYVVLADGWRHRVLESKLGDYGYEPVHDWIRFDPLVYGRTWDDKQVKPV